MVSGDPYPSRALVRCLLEMTMDPAGDPTDGGDGTHAEVADLLHASLTAPRLDSAARARHVQAIRDRAASLPAPAAVATADGWARRLASTVTAAGLVAVLSASGAVTASHGALPGDTLYPVKTASEQVALVVPLPSAQGVERYLSFADRRLDEAGRLVARDRDPALVAAAISAHARLMSRAWELAEADRDLAGRVHAATVAAQRQLGHLLARGLPTAAADQARAALLAADRHLDRRPATPPPAPPPTAPEPDDRPDTVRPRPDAPQPEPQPQPQPRPQPQPEPERQPEPQAPSPPEPRPTPGTPTPHEPGGPDGARETPQSSTPTTPSRLDPRAGF